MSDTADRIRKIVAEHLGQEIEKVTDDADLVEDLGADSMDAIELIIVLEEKFEVEISDDGAEYVKTVAHLVKLVEASLS